MGAKIDRRIKKVTPLPPTDKAVMPVIDTSVLPDKLSAKIQVGLKAKEYIDRLEVLVGENPTTMEKVVIWLNKKIDIPKVPEWAEEKIIGKVLDKGVSFVIGFLKKLAKRYAGFNEEDHV